MKFSLSTSAAKERLKEGMGLILIVAGDLGDNEYAEVFNPMYLSVCFSFRPPSRVCESEAVSTIEKNIVTNHLIQLYTQVNGTR